MLILFISRIIIYNRNVMQQCVGWFISTRLITLIFLEIPSFRISKSSSRQKKFSRSSAFFIDTTLSSYFNGKMCTTNVINFWIPIQTNATKSLILKIPLMKWRNCTELNGLYIVSFQKMFNTKKESPLNIIRWLPTKTNNFLDTLASIF